MLGSFIASEKTFTHSVRSPWISVLARSACSRRKRRQLVAEVFVFEPATDGALTDAGVTGGLGDGGGSGDGGEGGLLAKGQGSLQVRAGSKLLGVPLIPGRGGR